MTIQIQNQPHPLYFGMRAFKNFVVSVKDEMEAGELLETDQLANLIYAGIENACYRERRTMTVAFKDIYDEVEAMLFDAEKSKQIKNIYEAFQQSQFVKAQAQAKEAGEAKKKTSTGTKSKKRRTVS